MKFLLLALLITTVNTYAKPVDDILLMSPANRKALSIAVKDVADNYAQNNKPSKAQAFYRSMINIYPIGDIAHQVANQLNMTLNDEQTYSNFITMGDSEMSKQKFNHALSYFLMANELENNKELYQRIANTYQHLDNTEKMEYYQGLAIQSEQESTEDLSQNHTPNSYE